MARQGATFDQILAHYYPGSQLAMAAGVDMVITNGARPEDLYSILRGEDIGTRFLAKADPSI